MRYFIIESKHDMSIDQTVITSIFLEFIRIESYELFEKSIIFYYDDQVDLHFDDLILNIMSDTLLDLRIYVSYDFIELDQLNQHKNYVLSLLSQIQLNQYNYLDDKVILKHFLNHIDGPLKKMILRKYVNDPIMLKTIKTYLETNQNMIAAAKKLYIHRNTLIQRIDKFYQITNFDCRKFKDAFLIYHLLSV